MPPNELVEAQEIRLKLAHVIAGHIGKPFDELKATEVERNQSYDYGESQETVLDIVDEVLKAHEEWLAEQGLVVVPEIPNDAMRARWKDEFRSSDVLEAWCEGVSAALAEE